MPRSAIELRRWQRSVRHVRGRLFSAPVGGISFAIAQNYQFNSNPAYRYGAQAFDGVFIGEKRFNPRWSLLMRRRRRGPRRGRLNSTLWHRTRRTSARRRARRPDRLRYYDYGPGGNLLATFILRRDNARLVNFGWELHHLHSLDGVRANHLPQRARLEVTAARLRGVGELEEIGSRVLLPHHASHADDAGEVNYHFPQHRSF